MRQIYLYTTPSGPIHLIEGDKMPDASDYAENFQDGSGEGRFDQVGYDAALQAAKASSIPVQDREMAKKMIELLLYEKRKELAFQDIASLEVMSDVIYGPFSIEYSFEWINPCIKNKACLKQVDGRPCPTNCQSLYPVAILLPEEPDYINKELKSVSKDDLKAALRKVNQKNKEIRESYNDPQRLDFRVKDSKGFPTGEVIEEAKVKVNDDPILAVVRIAQMENLMPIQRYEAIKSQFTITRKQ